MFAVDCPSHGRKVLLCTDDITAVHHGQRWIAVQWRCPCGTEGTWRVHRGRSGFDRI
jgi:hypothetical protein